MEDGRRFAPELILRAVRRDDGKTELFAPRPGLFRSAVASGALVVPGGAVGELEVLGVLHRLRAPSDAYGRVEDADGPRLARRPVDYATLVCVLDPSATSGALAAEGARASSDETSGPLFRMPLGGRYYARPSPGADPFVAVGAELTGGETVAIIEVMKTFNRVTYGGPGLPQRARVKAVVPSDGADVETGDVLLELEAVEP